MIGYVILGTNELSRAASFYDALLAEIGLTRQMDFGERGYGWGANMDAVMLCVMTPLNGERATIGNGTMTAIGVDSRDHVNLIHAKALELGAEDEGAPGLRPVGGDGFYAAYFRDLDGHKLDVFTYGE
ncbi:MAG: VOC family protein [Halioglobus sp.]